VKYVNLSHDRVTNDSAFLATFTKKIIWFFVHVSINLKTNPMKKIQTSLVAVMMLFASASTALAAAPASPATTVPTEAETAEANALLVRLSEIDALDKTDMSSSEKKELRKEVKETKSRLRAIGGGVYVSVGALIIILLLLIILL
jgi:hypothetical protein